MYKPYKLNWFWEAAITVFFTLSIWKFMDFIGVPLSVGIGVATVLGMIFFLFCEIFIPRYRFLRAAAQIKHEPGKVPKAQSPGEVLAEILSEGPTFDAPIGRGPKKHN